MSDRENELASWLGLGFRPKNSAKLGRVIGFVLGFVFLMLVILGLSLLGYLLGLSLGFLESEDRGADIRNIGLVLAAVFGAPFVAWRSFIAQKQADVAEQGHITDRISKAVEQLGAEKTVEDGDGKRTVPNLEVRLGGIYALERIARDSDRDHVQVVEILCAYIRENAGLVEVTSAQTDKDGNEQPAEVKQRVDTQAALTVLGRRTDEQIVLEGDYRLDLRGADLRKADMANEKWQEARLDGANLQEAQINWANLQGAWLGGANLQKARLDGANLQKAWLSRADLQEAVLYRADLQGARLYHAKLHKAQLYRAKLHNARLHQAELGSAKLRGWSGARTSLRSADLSVTRYLTQESVNTTFGVRSGYGKTLLPAGLTPPDHWHVAADADEDTPKLQKAYLSAYKDWLATLPDDPGPA